MQWLQSWSACSQLTWAKQQIAQILTNNNWTLKQSNSGSRRAIEEPKKGKLSKFNGKNDGQVKSSPAVEGKSHEGSICTWKIAFWGKKEVLQGTFKCVPRSDESVSRVQGTHLNRNNWKKNEKKLSGLVTRRLYHILAKIPVLGNLTHI